MCVCVFNAVRFTKGTDMNETQYVRRITDHDELNILCWHGIRIINEIRLNLYYVNCKLLNVNENHVQTMPESIRCLRFYVRRLSDNRH